MSFLSPFPGMNPYLLISVKVCGIPLLISIFDAKIRPDDDPKLWL